MTEGVDVKLKTDKGLAPIKKEFLDLNHKPRLVVDYLPQTTASELQHLIDTKNGDEPTSKRPKLTGRNRKRPFEKRCLPSEKLCPNIAMNKTCSFGERCKFSHDVAKFYKPLPTGTDTRCHVFESYGRCQFGITCIFAAHHTDESLKNIVNQELVDKFSGRTLIFNILSKDLQIRLRKREYDFSRANRALKQVEKEVKSAKSNPCAQKPCNEVSQSVADTPHSLEDGAVTSKPECDESSSLLNVQTADETVRNTINTDGELNDASVAPECSVDSVVVSAATAETDHSSAAEMDKVGSADAHVKSLGCVTDEDVIKLREDEKKKIDFRGKLYLAPLTTVGNLPFRRICKRLGADITCGEMAMSSNLLHGQQSEWALIKRHESENLFGMQLCGSFADTMTRTVQAVTENMHVDFIDVNIGCPIDLVVQKGEGCALMGRPARLEHIVKSIKLITDKPLTIKMRTGLQEDHNIAHTVLPKLAKWNVAMATVHGRSREQRYTKLADWQYIKTCVEAASPMPIFGNGDIMSFHDYQQCFESSGVAGCMIARGALIKPWVFTEIKEQRDWDISATERFEIVKEFVNYGLEHWGSDQQGVANTRRFLLEWLSFLHRYIPVGLLERVPQRINERPPYYFGRSDLETMLASPNCADWIKIRFQLCTKVVQFIYAVE